MDSYAFDAAWEKERDRLRALEAVFDHASTRRLADLGVGAGWRCLEVGCGAGGVALWLAAQVGPAGHVLATDLDTRFAAGHAQPNLDVRAHDIAADALEPGSFDLAHTRNVLAHLPDRRRALERMIAAVRPGGWILVEDTDVGQAMLSALSRYVHPAEYAALLQRIYRALQAVFTTVGADASIGPQLAGWPHDAGLEHVGARQRRAASRSPGRDRIGHRRGCAALSDPCR
jgi:SAM-dependent methyltransferase